MNNNEPHAVDPARASLKTSAKENAQMALNDQDKPHKPAPTLEERQRAAFEATANVMQKSMQGMARTNHGILAELSRIASLATLRLDQANDGQSTAGRDLAAVRSMLQEIETAGHQVYLAKHGSEEDYQAIGAKVEKKYRTPSGRWRG